MWEIINKPSFKNILTLMSGTALAQVATLAIYPILTSLYSPEEFGVYGLFSAILLAIVAIANGGYNDTIMLPKKNSDAYNLLILCGIFVIGVSTIIAVIVVAFKDLIANLINSPGNSYWLLLLPLSLLLEGFYFAFSAILNREGNYKSLTRAKVLQAFISGLVSLVMGYWFSDISGGLIIGMICGQFFSFVSMLIVVIKLFPVNEVSWQQIKIISKEYKEFPKYGLAAGYLNTLSRQIPFFIIPVYFGTEVLGHFTLAHKILTAPITFLVSSFSMIYYQKAARAKDERVGYLKNLNYKISLGFGMISIIPVLLMIFIGPEIFSFVFGADYANAGKYARWIVAWVAMMYILSPLSFLIDIYGKLKFFLFYNILLVFSRIVISALASFLSAEVTIALFGLTGLLFSSMLFVWLLNLGPKEQMQGVSVGN